MLAKRIKDVGNPLVYIFLSLIISCIYYEVNQELRWFAIFIVASFFICVLYYCGISFACFMVIFFGLGILVNVLYYDIPDKISGEVRITSMSSYGIYGEYEGKLIVLKTNKRDLKIGQKYELLGRVQGGKDESKGIVGEVEIISIQQNKWDLISKLYSIREDIYFKLEQNLGKRKAGLIASIAFGYSDYLDFEDKSDMNNWGIIHSISVSGLHVVIVYGFFRIFVGSKIGILATVLYVIFTGSNYASIRAFLMLACVEGGHILKRNNNSISALCLSAIILIIYQPYCIFNISFQLSYLATLGIAMFNKIINEKLYKLYKKLRESISLTLSAQIFTLPFLILIFKNFSANFIVGNLLLAPFVDLMVITGNILVITYRFPNLFDFFSYVNLYLIRMFDWILDIIDNISLPMLYGNEYVVFFYFFLMFSFYFVKKGYKKFIYLPLIAIFILTIQIYSPILSIRYYSEGAILVSYKSERILVMNKNKADIGKLSKSAFATKYYRKGDIINVEGVCRIKFQEKNYILETSKKKYLLKVTSTKNEYKDYDIINFKDIPMNTIFIVNGEIA